MLLAKCFMQMKFFLAISLFLEKRKYICLFLSFIMCLVSLSAKEKSVSINQKCLSCHSMESICEGKFKINEKNFFASVHANLKCVDCHKTTLRATKEDIPHEKDLLDVNCIANCHQLKQQTRPGANPLDYPSSVHGKAHLEREVQDAAKCWDCHTKHNIKRPSDLDSTVNKINIPLTCSVCHEDMNMIVKYNIHCEKPYQEYLQGVHGKALYKGGLLSLAAVCTDCHGIHDIKGVGEPSLMAKNPETCGKCHGLVFNEYKESIHGREALKGNYDVPLCVDCHSEHKMISPLEKEAPTSWKNINDTCSACHARKEIMQKYGIPEDRKESFSQSLHGIAVGYGYKAAANCTSCHGVHNIKPAEDRSSKVNPANLAKTCGQENCHPGMPEKIASSKIHIDIGQKKSGLPYYVQQTFLWLVFITSIITIIWFIPGIIRRIKLLKNR